jgi:hypothetical protein
MSASFTSLHQRTATQLEELIDEWICETYGAICRHPVFLAAARKTHCGAWIAEDFHVTAVLPVDPAAQEIRVALEYTACLPQEALQLRIVGRATAFLREGAAVEYEVHTAKLAGSQSG